MINFLENEKKIKSKKYPRKSVHVKNVKRSYLRHLFGERTNEIVTNKDSKGVSR